MKVILFGASGMVGQGVLRECLLEQDVDSILAVSRSSIDKSEPKLQEIIHPDVSDLESFSSRLTGYDACFFCLGVTSAGMSEADYRKITYDLTLGAARTLAALNPKMTFVYITGAGTDSSEKGRIMWARVKGATENALLCLPFKAAYMFRPGVIQPLHGITSKTRIYRMLYHVAGPLISLAKVVFPDHVTTTEQIGQAMIKVARNGAPKVLLETVDINLL